MTQDNLPAPGAPDIEIARQAKMLHIDDVARIGPDVRITAHPVTGQEEE